MIEPTTKTRLGRTKVEVCRLGFGSAPLGGLLRETSAAEAANAVAAALAAGLTYFDCAPQYGGGLAETRLGEALQGVPRDRITLSTKIGKLVHPPGNGPPQNVGFIGAPVHGIAYDYSYDGVMRSLEASLKRLKLERVDVLLIHDVNRKYHGEHVHQRLEEAVMGACRALVELRGAGVIGAFGPATKDLDIACAFLKRVEVDCVMVPARLTLIDSSACEELIPLCERQAVSVLAAAPFDSGILATGTVPGATYDYAPASEPILAYVRSIEKLCMDFDVTLAAAALQFPLRHSVVASVVTGMRDRIEVESNLSLLRQTIPNEFWDALQLVQAGRRQSDWSSR
jgi:D-threo-aldose 1-dehydrogenase